MKFPSFSKPLTPKPVLTPELKNKLLDTMWDKGLVPLELQGLYRHKNSYMGYSIDSMEERIALIKFREQYVRKYGFSLLSEALVKTLSEQLTGKNCVEVGAGSGWLSFNLQQKGVDITPIDIGVAHNNAYGFHKPFTDVLEVSAQEYFKTHNSNVILMSWPNYQSEFAYETLQLLQKGQTLVYLGEDMGGCCAEDKFFNLLSTKCELQEKQTSELQAQSLRWPSIHDDIWVYTVK